MGKAWRALNLVGDDDDDEDIGDDDEDDDGALSSRRSRLRQDASSLGAEHKLCGRLQVRYSSETGVDKILENNISQAFVFMIVARQLNLRQCTKEN